MVSHYASISSWMIRTVVPVGGFALLEILVLLAFAYHLFLPDPALFFKLIVRPMEKHSPAATSSLITTTVGSVEELVPRPAFSVPQLVLPDFVSNVLLPAYLLATTGPWRFRPLIKLTWLPIRRHIFCKRSFLMPLL